ncbi:hypothetical protein DFJ58DRAFT_788800 [Suillus subalutaceus]|uniref:uncharacterized protein n=1 Tax=Suillus subalutaceus TaxID=48586 RepID=UPI001B86068C|nr:uncharacterized protein DFJ58DRAFT_788800 [Suillus subalutaceus]KAG1853890.1 hypothetical protein DFJ58DRAFT_788800 [Suillus subalutaceus]
MSTETITKRLHISGLTTPAITPADLAKRLGAFGRVISLDGFGKLDALGQPRPFGYATIEGHKTDLARCVNVLSGTVWKGAKLRIGDAKPDFRERLASVPSPPHKKRRANSKVGTHAPDMSLVTPETAHTRGGWRVTEMGRVVRIMRMRPEKPLEPPRVLTSAGNKYDKDGKLVTGKRKKRVKLPPTRTRRRTIDPTRWDSTHLKGIWLDAEVAGAVDLADHAGGAVIPRKRRAEAPENSDNEQDTESAPSDDEDDDHESSSPPVPKSTVSPLPPPELLSFPTARSPETEAVTEAIPSLTQEKHTSLAFLRSLFGDGDEGWGGQESLSDIEDARLGSKGKAREPQTGTRINVDEGDIEIEEVPHAKYKDINMGSDTTVSPLNSQSRPTSTSKPSAQDQKQTNLKDLFAPREEEAGFSLLGHLDLGFEEEDMLGISDLPHPSQPHHALPPHVTSAPHEQPQAHPTLDSSFPFFFPLPPTLRSRSSNTRNTPRDIFSLFPHGGKEKDKNEEPFSRTQTTSEIHSQWEAQKGALTREWKARWREASKGKRGRDE